MVIVLERPKNLPRFKSGDVISYGVGKSVRFYGTIVTLSEYDRHHPLRSLDSSEGSFDRYHRNRVRSREAYCFRRVGDDEYLIIDADELSKVTDPRAEIESVRKEGQGEIAQIEKDAAKTITLLERLL